MFVCVCSLFKQKTAYEMRISDWSSDVCSSDLRENVTIAARPTRADDTGCLHLLDHARRTVVADLQAALHPRYRGLARFDHHRDGLIVDIGRASGRASVWQYVQI